MFNPIAPRYDLVNFLMTLGLDKSWRRFTARRSGLKPGGCGLDLRCGTAMLTIELARMFRQAALVETSCHNLAGGIVAVVEGKKPIP